MLTSKFSESAPHQVMESIVSEQPMDSSMLDQSMNLSTMDVNQSTSIRSSRRRVKGSAVVLNTDRLQKYIQKDRSDISQDNHTADLNEKEAHSVSIASARQPPTESVRIRALFRIQRWWKQYSSTRLVKFTQLGVWNVQTAHKIFAALLGYRVRKLMKLKSIQLNIKAQQDIKRILSDMCNSMGSYTGGWERFREELAAETVDDLLLKYPTLSHSDLTLAKSMSKQLLMERNKLHSLIFNRCIWRQFPPPGYWDIAAALHAATTTTTNRSHVGASPARKVPSSKTNNMDTPPSVRRAVKQSSSGNKPKPLDAYINKYNSNAVQENSRPQTAGTPDLSQLPAHKQRNRRSVGSQEGPEVVHLRHSNDRAERVIEPQLLSTPDHHSSFAQRAVTSTPIATSSGAPAMASAQKSGPPVVSSDGSPHAKRHRDSERGHIQLHVLSAEKLMAAKKGAPVRDSLGGAVPDRIPCLKVRFSLPNWTPGAGGRNQPSPDPSSQALRKVYDKTRDFTTVTLNPQWGAAFIINLPCPRNIVQSLAYNEARQVYHPDEPLSDAAYDIISRNLLQWWALGTVNVEVFDGERFNEDIFMGHIDLLLSGFMVLVKKPDDLEIKGSFQLNKIKSSDRVSGSVKIHAFLHPPEKAYIAEVLDPTTRVPVQPTVLENASPDKAPVPGRQRRQAREPYAEPEEESAPVREQEVSPPSSSSHTSRSSPDATNIAPAVSFSSKFMQSLVRNSQYLIGVTSPVAEESSGGEKSAKSSPEVQTTRSESSAKKQVSPEQPPVERVFREPQLEETENIHFNAQTGEAVSQQNIAQSARLLKEKVRQAKHQRRPRGGAAASSRNDNGPADDALARNVTLTAASIASIQQLRRPAEREAAQLAPVAATASTTEQARKGQSVESSEQRRHSMLDISKQLAGLSAVQHSTNVVLDSLNYKLEAKLRSRDAPERGMKLVPERGTYVADGGDGEDDEGSGSEDAPPDSSYLSALEGADDDGDGLDDTLDEADFAGPHDSHGYYAADDNSESYEDVNQAALGLPHTAELRIALQSSFRSSLEDDDAPEMGDGSDTDDTRSYESYGAGGAEGEDFDDTYDEEDDDAQHYSQLDERSRHRYQHAPPGAIGTDVSTSAPGAVCPEYGQEHRPYKGGSMFRDGQDAQSSSSEGSEGWGEREQDEEVPVVRAVRKHTNLAAREHPHAFVGRSGGSQHPPAAAVQTIYADEEPEHEGADVDDTLGANYSTVSSVYSNNVQEFLSPDFHSRRPYNGGARSNSPGAHYFDGEADAEHADEPEELIVISSSGPSTMNSGSNGSPRRRFEVHSADNTLSSPSRSLFEARDGAEKLPSRNRGPRSAQGSRNAQNADNSVVSSPGDGPPQCVVLELDDLEL